jgi:4-hydroxy-tetrahydrodipicolinate synthase
MNRASRLPAGIVPLLETPFDEAGAIDFDSLGRLIDDVIAGGVNGLMAPLVASEVHALAVEERIELVAFCARAIRHRVPFVVGASSDDPETCRRFARLAEELGSDAYLVAIPNELYGSEDRILEFFRSIVVVSATPLIIQDLQWNGPGLDLDTIRRLRDALPTLCGMKIETVPAGPKYTAVRAALGGDFYISGGWAIPQLIEALDRGVDSMVPESALIRVFSAIYRAHSTGDRDGSIRTFRKLVPVLVFSNQELYHSIAFFKRLLFRKGIIRTATMRKPGYTWDPYSSRIADELIDYYLQLEREIGGTPQ